MLLYAVGGRCQDQFRADLNERYEALVLSLRDFDGGDGKTDAVVTRNGQTFDAPGMPWPASQEVVNALQSIGQALQDLPLSVLVQDTAGFDRWATALRGDVAQHAAAANRELERIAASFRSDPSRYRSALYGPSLRWARDSSLQFVLGNRAYAVAVVTTLDLDSWVEEVRAKTREMLRAVPETP
jgi:hypothetical protein